MDVRNYQILTFAPWDLKKCLIYALLPALKTSCTHLIIISFYWTFIVIERFDILVVSAVSEGQPKNGLFSFQIDFNLQIWKTIFKAVFTIDTFIQVTAIFFHVPSREFDHIRFVGDQFHSAISAVI